ncbi:MAG: transglutaminase domain-containing protein [Verrucomicrobiota bacterium]
MKTPPFLLGATLLFWGWQTELLVWALPMALLVETSHFISTRWDFSLIDLKRIWNLCAVLFFGAGVVLYSSEEAGRVALRFTQWLPFPFFPMMLAQVYGSREKMPLTVFSWILRRSPESVLANKTLNISFVYFGVCLLAASATSQSSPLFYPCIALLIALALAANRPKRLPQIVWMILIASVSLAGHFGHQQLHALHSAVEGTLARWLVGLFSRQYNVNESRTAIGRVGRIQLSGNIVLRVRPDTGEAAPPLLRDASYDVYKQGIWRSSQNEFALAFVETNEVVNLQPEKKLNFSVHIAGYLSRGRGQLALPPGVFALSNFPGVLKTNQLAWAKVEEGPGLLDLVASYGPGKTFDGAPTDSDSHVPRSEGRTVREVVESLNLDGKTEREKLEIISRFFRDNFTYSLDITRQHTDATGQKTPLGKFLTDARSGHCEYFGTAAVLLLREAKIPARYATGYLVDDSERKGKTYVVRERDAHAWALVFRTNKNVWEDFDVTPASADRAAKFKASRWEPLRDFFSILKFYFSRWRWSKTSYSAYLKWLLIPLILFLAWRIFSSKQRKKNAMDINGSDFPWPGQDSEFYLCDKKLSDAGLGRQPHELLSQWQARLLPTVPLPESLQRIFELHRRLRFDPRSVTSEDYKILKSEVQQWLEAFDEQTKSKEPAEVK